MEPPDGRLWDGFDLLLTPTVAGRAAASWAGSPPPTRTEADRITSFIPYTAQFNMTGQPAVGAAAALDAEGLPVGVQLVAAYGREDVLVRGGEPAGGGGSLGSIATRSEAS